MSKFHYLLQIYYYIYLYYILIELNYEKINKNYSQNFHKLKDESKITTNLTIKIIII